MHLHYRKMGQGESLVVIHGLYGLSDNWYTLAKQLSASFQVFLPDVRNHGASSHTEEIDYPSMARDIVEMLDGEGIHSAHLIGHSMGGKIALALAQEFPQRVNRLVIVDVSAGSYKETRVDLYEEHRKMAEYLHAFPFVEFTDRSMIEKRLYADLASERLTGFFLKNVSRDNTGKFRWKFNIEAIYKKLPSLFGHESDFSDVQLTCPVLLIKGERSNYILDVDKECIQRNWSSVKFVEIANAGHWVHVDQPEVFLNEVTTFLNP